MKGPRISIRILTLSSYINHRGIEIIEITEIFGKDKVKAENTGQRKLGVAGAAVR